MDVRRVKEAKFEASLNHAPVIALVDTQQTEQAFRAATACWAAGFRLIALGVSVPSAPQIVSAMGAREDLIMGVWGVRLAAQLAPYAGLPLGFAFGDAAGDLDEDLLRACEAQGVPFVPGAPGVHNEASLLNQCDARGGAEFVRGRVNEAPKRAFYVEGHIKGDELDTYMDAGARAVVLTDALMSPGILERGDYRAIRDYAAAVHHHATQLSVNAREKMT